MKIYVTVTDTSEKVSLEDVKLIFSVDETVLMTVFTDAKGVFTAEQDLSEYVGKKLKIKAQKEQFEATDVSYEVGREDIKIKIELRALQVGPIEKTVIEPNHQTKIKPILIGGILCVVVIALIAVYFATRREKPKIAKCSCELMVKQYVGSTLRDFRGRMTFAHQGGQIKSGSLSVDFQGSDIKSEIVRGTFTGGRFAIRYANRSQPNRELNAYGQVRFTSAKNFTITNGKYGERNLDWQARCETE